MVLLPQPPCAGLTGMHHHIGLMRQEWSSGLCMCEGDTGRQPASLVVAVRFGRTKMEVTHWRLVGGGTTEAAGQLRKAGGVSESLCVLPGTVACTFNPSTQKAEAGGLQR